MTVSNHNTCIGTILKQSQALLATVSQTAVLDTEVLMCYVTGLSRTQLLIHHHPLSFAEKQQFNHLIERRRKKEPIAYLIGSQEFFSLPFVVNSSCLIPRPETELLVEKILVHYPAQQRIQLLELGTGSGAIALAIAYHRPKWRILAVDYSKEALKIALKNKKILNISNITLRYSNWFQQIDSSIAFDGIVSNPPYLAKDDSHLEELSYEPRTALVSGEGGLEALYIIISKAKQHLAAQGILWLEHGLLQDRFISNRLEEKGYHDIKQYTDLSRIVRISVARAR